MDKEKAINKIYSLNELLGESVVFENILRSMSTDELEQHIAWICQDYDIEEEEL